MRFVNITISASFLILSIRTSSQNLDNPLWLFLQDAASYDAESAYKNSSTKYSAAQEPEPGYKAAESDYQEAVSQREAEYEPETVYEVAGAGDHYQAGRVFVFHVKEALKNEDWLPWATT